MADGARRWPVDQEPRRAGDSVPEAEAKGSKEGRQARDVAGGSRADGGGGQEALGGRQEGWQEQSGLRPSAWLASARWFRWYPRLCCRDIRTNRRQRGAAATDFATARRKQAPRSAVHRGALVGPRPPPIGPTASTNVAAPWASARPAVAAGPWACQGRTTPGGRGCRPLWLKRSEVPTSLVPPLQSGRRRISFTA